MENADKIKGFIVGQSDCRLLRDLLQTAKNLEFELFEELSFTLLDRILLERPQFILFCFVEQKKLKLKLLVEILLKLFRLPVGIVLKSDDERFSVFMHGFKCDLVKFFSLKDSDLSSKISQFISGRRLNLNKYSQCRFDLPRVEVLAIGSSVGGPAILREIFRNLPIVTPPVLVVQHMQRDFVKFFLKNLSQSSKILVKEAESWEILRSSHAYLAADEHHLVIKRCSEQVCINLLSSKLNYRFVPSIDLLFSSVAEVFGKNSVGIILSGLSDDGVRGLKQVKQAGGLTIALSYQEAVANSMPLAAVRNKAVDLVLSSDEIVIFVKYLILSQNLQKMKTAVFSAGCFWSVEYYFRQLPGVIDVIPGYTGGKTPNPTYEEVSKGTTGHVEAVLVKYDPEKISYEDLVKYFFEIHDFTQTNGQGPDVGPQYLSNIFYQDQSEYETALKLINKLFAKGYNVATGLIKFEKFWPAEEYHRRYLEKHNKKPAYHIHRPINWESDEMDYDLGNYFPMDPMFF